MRKFLALLVFFPTLVFASLVDPRLRSFAHQTSGSVKVIALMEQQAGMTLPLTGDRRGVIEFSLKQTQASWARVQPALAQAIANKDIQIVTMHWISQSFSANVTPAGLRILANASGVSKVYGDAPITMDPPLRRHYIAPGFAATALPYDLTIIGMDKVIQQYPQLTGAGVLVGHIDTGVDGTHPAIAGKIALFYDASLKKVTTPHDTDQHGTHTAGTILGGPHNGAPMGMAPGAKLVSVAGLNGFDDMLTAMQFMLSPDGSEDSAFTPHMISNSWNCTGAPDVEAFYRAISAWDAAGILPIFSAGNSGPAPASITQPHEHPATLAVGAFGSDGKIADFSSRGPGNYNGQETLKPDISAPGVDVVSSIPGGGYEAMSGTSMSAPHVTGLTALLFQISPNLTSAKVKEILAKSADFVDMNGNPIGGMVWNGNYGYGRINALKAVTLVQNFVRGFVNKFGNALAPNIGFMPPLDPNIGRPTPARQLTMPFATDKGRWVDSSQL